MYICINNIFFNYILNNTINIISIYIYRQNLKSFIMKLTILTDIFVIVMILMIVLLLQKTSCVEFAIQAQYKGARIFCS